MEEPVIFHHAVEGLYKRALTGKLSDNAWAELRKIGLDRGKVLPAYAFDVWVKGLEISSRDMFPGKSMADAHFELARLFVRGYAETLVGKALFSLLTVLGAKRVIDRMARNFRTGNNFTETRILEMQDKSCLIWFNKVEPHPQFTQGVLLEGLTQAGVKGATVELVKTSGTEATYKIQWQ